MKQDDLRAHDRTAWPVWRAAAIGEAGAAAVTELPFICHARGGRWTIATDA